MLEDGEIDDEENVEVVPTEIEISKLEAELAEHSSNKRKNHRDGKSKDKRKRHRNKHAMPDLNGENSNNFDDMDNNSNHSDSHFNHFESQRRNQQQQQHHDRYNSTKTSLMGSNGPPPSLLGIPVQKPKSLMSMPNQNKQQQHSGNSWAAPQSQHQKAAEANAPKSLFDLFVTPSGSLGKHLLSIKQP